MMLGYLLARASVDVYIIEKHKDFLRDFRGDTMHPSTLELMHELGLLDEFLKLPHQEILQLSGQVGSETVTIADFTHLSTHCQFLALMPQWVFLNFLANKGKAYPQFHLLMNAEVVDIIQQCGKVIGAKAKTQDGELEILADLTIGADGRRSVVRERALLRIHDLGAPVDVMWMRISRSPSDPAETFGHVEPGKILVMIDRDKYWQCAFVIPKGSADELRKKGIENFQQEIGKLSPFLEDRVKELKDWDDVSLLSVSVDRLVHWSKPGLLCIGDSAHAMAPVGGVGINLAIQDAVAAANILEPKLQLGCPSPEELVMVQRRREFPTRATQKIQTFVHMHVLNRVLNRNKPISLPWPLKLLRRWRFLRRIPARVVGVGFRPEHIQIPSLRKA